MSHVKLIFKNISWVLISQIISSILGFFWTILIARYLGVSDYGILGFATSIIAVIGITLDFGITSYAIRQIAIDNSLTANYIGQILPLKILFAIGSSFLLTIILILMKCDGTTIFVTLLFLIVNILQSIGNTLNGGFQAFEKVKYQSLAGIITNTLLFISILIIIYADKGLTGIAISYILANIVGLAYQYYSFNKHIAKPKFGFDKSFSKNLIICGLPFAITGILYSVYYSIDAVMLTNMVGTYATGLYNATYKLISVLTLFNVTYSSIVFPVMSKFFKNDKRLLVISYEKSVKYLSLVIVPLAVATIFYSSDIIQFIYGAEYIEASPILAILIWTVCLLFVNGAGNILLNASHKEVTVTKIYSIAAIFNVVLNFIMIPYLSYIGAAITTVLSDILIFIVQKYVIHKIGQKPNRKLYFDVGKIIIGSAVLGIALYLLNLNMWVAIPVGIIIYLAAITALNLFDDDDKYVIKEILGRN